MDNRTVRAAKLLNPTLQLWRWSPHLDGWVRVETPQVVPVDHLQLFERTQCQTP